MAINRPQALVGGATNMNDPRLQRQVLAAGANPLRNQIGAIQNVTQQHVSRDIGTRLRFAELGIQDRSHQDRMQLATKRLALNEKQFKFGQKMFKQADKDRHQDLDRSMLLGLGTAGWSFLEGKRRANVMRKQTAERQELLTIMKKYYGG